MLKAIVLPGLDGTGVLLEDFAAALARHFDVEVIAYPHDELLGYTQLCGLVRMRLPKQDYVLIAESFSGPVGLALAAERPAGLKALVLCASFARIDLPAKSLLSRVAAIMSPRWVPAPWLSRLLWGSWRTRERTQALRHALSRVRGNVLQLRAREALAADFLHSSRLDVPLLYLQAARDLLVGSSGKRNVQAIASNMRTHRLDAPHFLLQVCPREAAEAIASFVRDAHSGS